MSSRKVFISGGERYGELQLLTAWGYSVTKEIYDADIVLFTGGADVNPELYGHPRHRTTGPAEYRDECDIRNYQIAHAEQIPMFGICRGAQFLNVMQGGKMIQDIENHCENHYMMLLDGTREQMFVTSCHHQAMLPNPDNAIIVAVAGREVGASVYDEDAKAFVHKRVGDIVEGVIFPKIRAFGVQGHPEFSFNSKQFQQFRDWCKITLEETIVGIYDGVTDAATS